MASNKAVSGDFYFNISTGEVEEGKVSSWTDRTGPYSTREEAEHALEKAAARTTIWDSDDEAWSKDQDDWTHTEEARQHANDVLSRLKSKG